MSRRPAPPGGCGHQATALAAALGQTVIAVANFFVTKETLLAIPPLALAALRFAGTALIMGALLAAGRSSGAWPGALDLGRIALLGLVGVTLNQTLFFVGLDHTTPARASLIYALSPLIVLLLARLHGTERLTIRRLVGIGTAFAGVTAVLADRGALRGATIQGDLVILAGAVTWGAYTALGKRLIERYGAVRVTGLALITGALFFAPIGVPAALAAPLGRAPAAAWLGVGYVVVFNSVIAYILWYHAVRWLAPSRVAVFNNLQPPLTVGVAALAFGDPISLRFLAGAALVVGGVWVAQGSRSDPALSTMPSEE